VAVSSTKQIKLLQIFGEQLRHPQAVLDWGYLDHLADNYRDVPRARMVYDAIVHAQSRLQGGDIQETDIFVGALRETAAERKNRVKRMFFERAAATIRRNDLEERFHDLMYQKGYIGVGMAIDVSDYADMRSRITKFEGLRHTIDILDEIEANARVIDGFVAQENTMMEAVTFFEDWMQSREFEKLTETYDRMRYTMRRNAGRFVKGNDRERGVKPHVG
jgi:hypothetical protein